MLPGFGAALLGSGSVWINAALGSPNVVSRLNGSGVVAGDFPGRSIIVDMRAAVPSCLSAGGAFRRAILAGLGSLIVVVS